MLRASLAKSVDFGWALVTIIVSYLYFFFQLQVDIFISAGPGLSKEQVQLSYKRPTGRFPGLCAARQCEGML